jgi:hypothetical protein
LSKFLKNLSKGYYLDKKLKTKSIFKLMSDWPAAIPKHLSLKLFDWLEGGEGKKLRVKA